MTGPQQLVFMAEPAARRNDAATSHAAAKAVEPGPTEADILAVLDLLGPQTDDELCQALPAYYPPTLKSARSRLLERGLVVPTGETRLSLRNRSMNVWTLAR